MAKHYDDMSSLERDAFGMEHIFKRPVKWLDPFYFSEVGDESVQDDPHYWEVVPHYSTDASADYKILQKVRSTWSDARLVGDIDSFDVCLREIWDKRNLNRKELIASVGYQLHLLYEPGDFLHAVWQALNGE